MRNSIAYIHLYREYVQLDWAYLVLGASVGMKKIFAYPDFLRQDKNE